jgi:hypothetical protein
MYTTRKYNGDDSYSWAVFHKKDLPKGHRGIVFHGEARPVVSGCTRENARYHAQQLTKALSAR